MKEIYRNYDELCSDELKCNSLFICVENKCICPMELSFYQGNCSKFLLVQNI